jgi:hypothetical protein
VGYLTTLRFDPRMEAKREDEKEILKKRIKLAGFARE